MKVYYIYTWANTKYIYKYIIHVYVQNKIHAYLLLLE